MESKGGRCDTYGIAHVVRCNLVGYLYKHVTVFIWSRHAEAALNALLRVISARLW